jgi:hypothetical protein
VTDVITCNFFCRLKEPQCCQLKFVAVIIRYLQTVSSLGIPGTPMGDELGDLTVFMFANCSHETQNSLQPTVKQLLNFKVNKRTSEFARWRVCACLCVFVCVSFLQSGRSCLTVC